MLVATITISAIKRQSNERKTPSQPSSSTIEPLLQLNFNCLPFEVFTMEATRILWFVCCDQSPAACRSSRAPSALQNCLLPSGCGWLRKSSAICGLFIKRFKVWHLHAHTLTCEYVQQHVYILFTPLCRFPTIFCCCCNSLAIIN